MGDESCQKILFIARMQKLRWYNYYGGIIILDDFTRQIKNESGNALFILCEPLSVR